jgi:conserved oligomeric Golgi complex subunit 4
MDDLLKITDVAVLESRLKECIKEEMEINMEINQLLFQKRVVNIEDGDENDNPIISDIFSTNIGPKLEDLGKTAQTELERAKMSLLTVGEQLDMTSSTASKVTSTVRYFDHTKERLQETLTVTHGMISASNCLSAIKKGLEMKNFASAADNYEKCKDVVKEYNLKLNPDEQDTLDRAERIVQEATIQKFDAAIDANNENEIIESYRVFASLGMANDGLKRYIRFLRSQMKQLYEDERLSYDDNKIPHVQLMSKLLNLVSELMQTGKQTVQSCMRLPSEHGNRSRGGESVTVQLGVILSELHKECDYLASKLVKQFIDDKYIVELIKKQRDKEKFGLDQDGMEIPLSGQVDYTLNECALITQHCENYFRWLIQQGKVLCMDEMVEREENNCDDNDDTENDDDNLDGDDLDGGNDDEAAFNDEEERGKTILMQQQASDLAKEYGLTRETLGRSSTSTRLQELASLYVQLEAGFMENNAFESLERDDAVVPSTFNINPENGNLTKDEGGKKDFYASSAIEEIFFIFQNSALRALASGIVDNYCAVINFIGNVISSVIIEEYGQNVASVKDDAKEMSSSKDGESPNALLNTAYELVKNVDSCATVLNNMHSVTKYTERLIHRLRQEGRAVFYENGDQDKIAGCLEMLSSYSKQCKSVLDAGLGKLASSHRLRVRGVMDALNGAGSIVSYDLTEDEFEEIQVRDPFRSEIVDRLRIILDPYRHSFSSRNFEFLVHHAIETVSRRVEGSLRRKIFSQYGGLKFERDVRSLIVFFSERSTRNVRKRFLRLTEMALLLSADNLNDATEYIEDKSIVSLNDEDIQKTLSLRKEFDS